MIDINQLKIGMILEGLVTGNRYKIIRMSNQLEVITIFIGPNNFMDKLNEKFSFYSNEFVNLKLYGPKEKLTFKSFAEKTNVFDSN